MKEFRLKIITPEKTFFDGMTAEIVARTTEGDVGVLSGHSPYVANLVSGPLKIMLQNGEFRVAAVSEGAISVSADETVILASAVEWADEIDVERAKRSEEDARRRLAEYSSQKEFDLAERKLKRALNRLTLAGK